MLIFLSSNSLPDLHTYRRSGCEGPATSGWSLGKGWMTDPKKWKIEWRSTVAKRIDPAGLKTDAMWTHKNDIKFPKVDRILQRQIAVAAESYSRSEPDFIVRFRWREQIVLIQQPGLEQLVFCFEHVRAVLESLWLFAWTHFPRCLPTILLYTTVSRCRLL